ncbi:MAG TPA: hypothetical protein VJJ48_01380 [Candidatus Paceibacterota bacterium]
MTKTVRYWLWKRRATKAVEEGLIAKCCACDDPIVSGDFIGIGIDKDKKEVLIHAGYHFSLKEMDAFCESAAIGCAYWDDKQVVGLGESLAAKAIRTGQPQIR